jgi:hypothetical protein
MGKCKDNYEEGDDITYQGIMLKAEIKYQGQTMNNEWDTLISSINSFKPKK